MAITLLTAIGGINSQNNLLFVVFGLLSGGLLVSGILSGSGLMGLRLTLERVPVATAGERAWVAVRLSNANRWVPVFGLRVGLPGLGRGEGFAQIVRPGEQVTVWVPWTPSSRGATRLRSVRARSAFPFGLMEKRVEVTSDTETHVRPRRMTLRGAAVRVASAAGERPGAMSRRPGRGEEFFGLRDYRPGDPLRAVAWKRVASTGRLVIRQHTAPVPRSLWIRLDLDRSQVSGRPLADDPATEPGEAAIALAAALAREHVKRGVAVGLDAPAFGVVVSPSSGPEHGERVAEALAELGVHEPIRRAGGPADPGRDASVLRIVAGGGGGQGVIDSSDSAFYFDGWADERVAEPERPA
ncbi:MAG: DUF58 domain-containing protein [Planctomycetota bacterium]